MSVWKTMVRSALTGSIGGVAFVFSMVQADFSIPSVMFKCPGPDGTFRFTDQPCSDGFVKEGGVWVSMAEKSRLEVEFRQKREEEHQKYIEEYLKQHKEKKEAAERLKIKEERERREWQFKSPNLNIYSACRYKALREFCETDEKKYASLLEVGTGLKNRAREICNYEARGTVSYKIYYQCVKRHSKHSMD